MFSESELVKLILGLKVRQLRRDRSLSYQQLSELSGLAISYLHSIEKGKKYPKTDKLITLAKALGVSYDYLVSLEADKKLQPIIDLLRSEFLQLFPMDLFGIDTEKLVDLLAQAPNKMNAFISTVLKITRNFNMQGEDFYKAALRSYQDLHENYFEDVEEAAQNFSALNTWEKSPNTAALEQALQSHYGITVNRQQLPNETSLRSLQSHYQEESKTLYLNDKLDTALENFLLAKELGFHVLKTIERPYQTAMVEVKSFDVLLANFKASYFADALLMPEAAIVGEIERIASWKRWDNQSFGALLERYTATPEMLLQRLSNLLPRHFGINNLFFLRFYTNSAIHKFIMTKEMHLSQLHDPHANQLDEHYCRRWISINLIRRLRALQGVEAIKGTLLDVQISKYWGTTNHYFCIAFSQPARDDEDESISYTIGLRIDDNLKKRFRFLDDPAIISKDVHTTCERCGITDCGSRAEQPFFLKRLKEKETIQTALKRLN